MRQASGRERGPSGPGWCLRTLERVSASSPTTPGAKKRTFIQGEYLSVLLFDTRGPGQYQGESGRQ